MKTLLGLLFLSSLAWALPENLPKGYKFSFLKTGTDKKQVCTATPIAMFQDSRKCLVKFFTAAHCAQGDFDYFKADFISGKVRLPKRGFIRHSDYSALKKPSLDFARFSLRMPCEKADSLAPVVFAPLLREGIGAEVSLGLGQRVFIRNLKGDILSGTIQTQNEYAFSFRVKLDGQWVGGNLVRAVSDLSPGDSGSLIFNEKGEVLGVLSGRKGKGEFYFSSLAIGWLKLGS